MGTSPQAGLLGAGGTTLPATTYLCGPDSGQVAGPPMGLCWQDKLRVALLSPPRPCPWIGLTPCFLGKPLASSLGRMHQPVPSTVLGAAFSPRPCPSLCSSVLNSRSCASVSPWLRRPAQVPSPSLSSL